MYKTPNQGYQMLEDMVVHNLEWNPDKRMMHKRTTINSLDDEASEEVAALRAHLLRNKLHGTNIAWPYLKKTEINE